VGAFLRTTQLPNIRTQKIVTASPALRKIKVLINIVLSKKLAEPLNPTIFQSF